MCLPNMSIRPETVAHGGLLNSPTPLQSTITAKSIPFGGTAWHARSNV